MREALQEVIGFDLGHGETAVAKASLVDGRSPRPVEIENRRSIFTAIGYRGREVYIGEKALRVPGLTARSAGFKCRPPIPRNCVISLTGFLKECIRSMVEGGRIMGSDSAHFFIGCPSSWSQKELQSYKTVLSSVVERLSVVRESRAALLHAKEAGDLAADHLASSVMVLDLGSLTTDATLVVEGNRDVPLEAGEELGGHLIEKEILRRAISDCPDSEAISAFLESEEGRHEQARAEAICRGMKEDYWRRQEEYELDPEEKRFNIGRFRLKIANIAAEVAAAVDSPIPSLDARSWRESFADVLDRIRARFEKQHSEPSALVLTGGASRMSFVPVMCKEYFPNTKLIHLSNPEETVALGLAWWGKLFFQTDSFSREVSVYCQDELPGLIRQFEGRLNSNISEGIASGITSGIVRPALQSWRSGRILTLNRLESLLQERIVDWLKSESGQLSVQDALRPVLRDLQDSIFRKTFEICKKYRVPPGSLRLDLLEEAQRSEIEMELNPFDGAITTGGFVSGIAMFVSYIVLKPFTVGALSAGPPGWAVLLSLMAMAGIVGTSVLTDSIKGMNIPVSLRRVFLRDGQLNKTIREMRTSAKAEMQEQFEEKQLPEMIRLVTEQTSLQLEAKVREVKWIID